MVPVLLNVMLMKLLDVPEILISSHAMCGIIGKNQENIL